MKAKTTGTTPTILITTEGGLVQGVFTNIKGLGKVRVHVLDFDDDSPTDVEQFADLVRYSAANVLPGDPFLPADSPHAKEGIWLQADDIRVYRKALPVRLY